MALAVLALRTRSAGKRTPWQSPGEGWRRSGDLAGIWGLGGRSPTDDPAGGRGPGGVCGAHEV